GRHPSRCRVRRTRRAPCASRRMADTQVDTGSTAGGIPVVVRHRTAWATSSRSGGVALVVSPSGSVHHSGRVGASVKAGLARGDIHALLDELSAELATRGAKADLFLVGGAAIAVAYDEARSTRDLDAVFLPTDVVRQAALVVAENHGLAKDWLNDAVKGFL